MDKRVLNSMLWHKDNPSTQWKSLSADENKKRNDSRPCEICSFIGNVIRSRKADSEYANCKSCLAETVNENDKEEE
jgi:hypothetical protein